MVVKDKILILDDDEIIQSLGVDIKEKTGMFVYVAGNITAADDFILDTPGIQFMKYIIVDLYMRYDEEDFDQRGKDIIKKISPDKSRPLSGWAWLVTRVLPNFPCENIIVVSNYVNFLSYTEKRKYGDGIHFINKSDSDAREKILHILK